jgi:hypothetical protein
MLQSSTFDPWLALPGIAIGLFLVAGSLEFVGRFEEKGWKLAGTIRPDRLHRLVALANRRRARTPLRVRRIAYPQEKAGELRHRAILALQTCPLQRCPAGGNVELDRLSDPATRRPGEAVERRSDPRWASSTRRS